mmetsp:Transcript_1841/g.4107  ORF Transcript_1841/g.4107 Transcript_1841/m.4107 type:complete len:160 (+) Transcript_1841:3-482(+)
MANYGSTEDPVTLSRTAQRPHLLHLVIGGCMVLAVVAAGWTAHAGSDSRVVELGYPYWSQGSFRSAGRPYGARALPRLSEEVPETHEAPAAEPQEEQLPSLDWKSGDRQWDDFKDYKVQSALKGLLFAEDKQRSLMHNLKPADQFSPQEVGEAFSGPQQ